MSNIAAVLFVTAIALSGIAVFLFGRWLYNVISSRVAAKKLDKALDKLGYYGVVRDALWNARKLLDVLTQSVCDEYKHE